MNLAHFDGNTFDADVDGERLTSQYQKVFDLMKDGQYRTLEQIAATVESASESSVSARLRDMRKKRFGSHTVIRRRLNASGLFEYSLIVHEHAAAA